MSISVPLYGFGSGGAGGTRGTLTVTAPAGVAVTVSKNGKTHTKTVDADGQAVFKSLESGTWTVTITDGVQISPSKLVEVTTDYEVAITFFAATISVTYPAGSVCTCSDGVTTLTAPDTSGTWACVVPNAGTWAVTAGSRSESVTIIATGEATDVDLVKTYLFKAGEQYADTTGGWTSNNYYYYSHGYTMYPAKIGKTIHTYCAANSSSSSLAGTVYKVDLTDINTVFVEDTKWSGSGSVYIVTGYSVHSSTAVSAKTLAIGINAMDVSKINGSYYIVVGGATSSSNYISETETVRIWME